MDKGQALLLLMMFSALVARTIFNLAHSLLITIAVMVKMLVCHAKVRQIMIAYCCNVLVSDCAQRPAVHLVRLGLLVVAVPKKGEWKCAMEASGEQCVMTRGAHLMHKWSADSWDM